MVIWTESGYFSPQFLQQAANSWEEEEWSLNGKKLQFLKCLPEAGSKSEWIPKDPVLKCPPLQKK